MRGRGSSGIGAVLLLWSFAFPGVARAEPWLSPSGVHGAGLGLHEDQKARIWLDSGLFTRSGDWAFSPLFGVGVLVTPSLEIEGVIPLSITTGSGGDTVVG